MSQEPFALPPGSDPAQRQASTTIPDELALLPLFNTVIYPMTVVPLALTMDTSIRMLDEAESLPLLGLVTLRSERQRPAKITADDFYPIGTAAIAHRLLRLPDGTLRMAFEGVERIVLTRIVQEEPFFVAQVSPMPDDSRFDQTLDQLVSEATSLALELLHSMPTAHEELRTQIAEEKDARQLSYTLASGMLFRSSTAERHAIMALTSPRERLERIVRVMAREFAQLRQAAQAPRFAEPLAARSSSASQQQRLPRPAMQEAAPSRPAAIAPESPWMGSVPDMWQQIDLHLVRSALDRDMYGLMQAKNALMERLAGAEYLRRAGSVRFAADDFLCLAGPAGVGKTALLRTLAQALGQPFVRLSLYTILGGAAQHNTNVIADSILSKMQANASESPIILLDDLDAFALPEYQQLLPYLMQFIEQHCDPFWRDIGSSTAWNPGQGFVFGAVRDQSTLPAPLAERAEIMMLAGYSIEDRLIIMQNFLFPHQLAAHFLPMDRVRIADEVYAILAESDSSPGLTQIDRRLAGFCRRAAALLLSGVEQVEIGVDWIDGREF